VRIVGAWVRQPYVSDWGVDYIGWDWYPRVSLWPPGISLVQLKFRVWATISLEVQCTLILCGRILLQWNYAPSIGAETTFRIAVGVRLNIPFSAAVRAAQLMPQARAIAASHLPSLAAQYAYDPTVWCALSAIQIAGSLI